MRSIALAGMAVGALLLAGCSHPTSDLAETQPLGFQDNGYFGGGSDNVVPVVSSAGESQGDENLKQDLDIPPGEVAGQIGGLGEPDVVGESRRPDSDYIDKADVYWKLNWIRKRLLNGSLPPDLLTSIKKARTELLTTDRDRNYDVADDAINHLDEGADHLRAMQDLDAAQLHAENIPWGSGEAAMRHYIDSGGLGFGKKLALDVIETPGGSTDGGDPAADLMEPPNLSGSMAVRSSLTPEQQRAIQVVMDYETKYHQSPETMMREEWRAAVEKINTLRDDLGLMNRSENNDGDDSEPGVQDGTRIQTSVDAPSGVDGVVPVPDISRPIPGSKMPEPTDITKPVTSTMDDRRTPRDDDETPE